MNYLLYILLAIMPFVITDSLWDYSDLPKTLFIQNGVILLAVVFFWSRRLKRKGYFEWDITVSKTLIAYMMFLAWTGLSIFWAINKHEALIIFSHWVICGMFLFLVHNLNINRTVIITIVFLTAWIVTLFGLGQHFFQLDWVLQSYRPASTFANRNATGAYILMAMPLGVGLMVSAYQGRFRTAYQQRFKKWDIGLWFVAGILAIAMATMAMFMYVGNCRLGMVGIVVLGSYYLIKYLHKIKRTRLGVLIVTLFLVSAFCIKPNFFEHGAKDKTLRLWNTLEIIKKHPVAGVGIGNFKVHYDKYTPLNWNTNDAHNDYVQVVCELGIIGAYLAFLVIFYAFRGSFKKCDIYSTSLKAGLGAFMVIAIFWFPMAMAVDPFICALYLGILKA